MRVFLMIPVLVGLAGPALADGPATNALTLPPGGKPCRAIWPPEPGCGGGGGLGYGLPGVPMTKLPLGNPFGKVPLNPNHPGGPLVEQHPERLGPYLGPGPGRVVGR